VSEFCWICRSSCLVGLDGPVLVWSYLLVSILACCAFVFFRVGFLESWSSSVPFSDLGCLSFSSGSLGFGCGSLSLCSWSRLRSCSVFRLCRVGSSVWYIPTFRVLNAGLCCSLVVVCPSWVWVRVLDCHFCGCECGCLGSVLSVRCSSLVCYSWSLVSLSWFGSLSVGVSSFVFSIEQLCAEGLA